ncbi:MAG: flagellar hook-basal body complex protein [Candidatus Gastranaerophilales bacterium]|nr:flagellar hook-basal body complex protein [Candidatus Gastranaerophilales bacterium]
MTQALFTSMTGLNAGTEQLTVVSDNVANMNTTAYKTSRVDFQDIWYKTRTTGTNSTQTMGGTNPYQVGVGVRCASISKDFAPSTVNTTGRATDMAITGNGWFTILNSDGRMLLTRDGTFALDENGYLCTANGFKVLGTDTNVSMSNCDIPIKLPTALKVEEYATKNIAETRSDQSNAQSIKFEDLALEDLNGLGTTHNGISAGTFYVEVTGVGKVQITLPENAVMAGSKVSDLRDAINTQTNQKIWNSTTGTWDAAPALVVKASVATTDDEATNGRIIFTGPTVETTRTVSSGTATTTVTAKNADGATISTSTTTAATTDPDGSTTTTSQPGMKFESGTSNLVAATSIAAADQNTDGTYYTKVLNYTATISQMDDITSDTTKMYESFSVGLDGVITVTYSDGSVLTVAQGDEGGDLFFSYTDPNGYIINDNHGNTGAQPLYVDPNVLVLANMQMQLAKVTNDYGLVAQGNNQYSIGVDCGDVVFTASNINGVGAVTTGALEASNVDLAQQFANMILAQRLVQANSQVFSGANQMLQTLTYLAQ